MPTIVVIEDELQILSNLEELLTLSGYDVIAASNGLSGLERVKGCRPDLVICDVMMPGLDGYGVLTALRQEPATVDIPVILLTARAERKDHRQGMELGADDYITKPFSTNEVLRAIEIQITKRNLVKSRLQQAQKHLGEAARQAESYRQQEEQSRELLLLKDELIKKVLEDLSNPISNINLAIRMLASASTEEQRQQYLQVLRHECDREMKMLNEVAELQALLTPEKAAILQRFKLLKPLP